MASRLQKCLLTAINLNIHFFMHLNTLVLEGVRRFHQTLSGANGTKNLRTPGL